MNWKVLVRSKVKKDINKFPSKDSDRIKKSIRVFEIDPFFGNIMKIEGEKNAWRKRVGNYRIFYELFPEKNIVFVYKVKRKTTTTYN